jgi:hypothetical protein
MESVWPKVTLLSTLSIITGTVKINLIYDTGQAGAKTSEADERRPAQLPDDNVDLVGVEATVVGPSACNDTGSYLQLIVRRVGGVRGLSFFILQKTLL